MKRCYLLPIILLLAAPAWAQTECSSQGLQTLRFVVDILGIRHQAECFNVVTGQISMGTNPVAGNIINAGVGFQIGGLATTNHLLLGNGTTYVDSATVPAAALNPSVPAHTYLGNNTGGTTAASFLQPACGDLSNSKASCSTDATNASNITSGTLAAAQMNPSVSAHTYLGNNSGGTAAAGFIQPACGDLSNSQPSCSTDTTNASNISSGTLAAARMNPSVTAHTFLGNNTGSTAAAAFSQPACGDLSNSAASCSTDATNAGNISSGTLATARGGTGVSGSATFPSTGTVVTETATETLTNKRVTLRVVSMADATSITPTSDTADENTFSSSQAAGTLTVNAPSGTPTDGQKLVLRLKATNAQTYSFNATYHFSTTTVAPVTLAAGKTDYLGLIFNAAASVWDVVAVDQGHTD